MSEIGQRINAVIGHSLAPCLREAGFRRKARTFHRVETDRIDVINVQGSKWNQGRTGEFTINVGIYFPQIAELYDPYLPEGLPQEYHCTIRRRLGQLMGKRIDKWWKLGRFTKEDKLSVQLAGLIREFALPWMEEMSDLENVKPDVPRFIAAAVAYHQGRMDEARQYVIESYDETPARNELTRDWAVAHGLGDV